MRCLSYTLLTQANCRRQRQDAPGNNHRLSQTKPTTNDCKDARSKAATCKEASAVFFAKCWRRLSKRRVAEQTHCWPINSSVVHYQRNMLAPFGPKVVRDPQFFATLCDQLLDGYMLTYEIEFSLQSRAPFVDHLIFKEHWFEPAVFDVVL